MNKWTGEEESPLFTIVIPTYDSDQTLSSCLESIRNQTLKSCRTVIVDDVRTADRTRDIVKDMECDLIISPAGMAESRNVGFCEARSPFLLSIDSDMVLSSNLLEALAREFDAGWDALTITEISVGQGYWTRARALDKAAVEKTHLGSAIRAFRREVFVGVAGYDSDLLAGEDLDFHIRASASGARVSHLSTAWIEHNDQSLSLIAAGRKKYAYGLSMASFEAKHGSALVSGFWRRFTVGVTEGFRRDPLAVPGYVVLRWTEAIAGQAGRLRHAWKTSPLGFPPRHAG